MSLSSLVHFHHTRAAFEIFARQRITKILNQEYPEAAVVEAAVVEGSVVEPAVVAPAVVKSAIFNYIHQSI